MCLLPPDKAPGTVKGLRDFAKKCSLYSQPAQSPSLCACTQCAYITMQWSSYNEPMGSKKHAAAVDSSKWQCCKSADGALKDCFHAMTTLLLKQPMTPHNSGQYVVEVYPCYRIAVLA